MKILNLPCDCIQLIFDRIPTHHHQLHTRRVCRAWKRHQQLNCRRRKSLIILQGKWSLEEVTKPIYNKPFVAHNLDQNGRFKNHLFFINRNKIHLTTSLANSIKAKTELVKIFPNLETLILATNHVIAFYIKTFTHLFTQYSSQLVSLQIYLGGDFYKIRNSTLKDCLSDTIGNLVNQLNSCSSLQHLTLHTDHWSMAQPSIEEPIFMTRIKEFYFNCSGGLADVMLDWLKQYGENGQLRRLIHIYLTNYPTTKGVLGNDHFGHFNPFGNLYPFVPYVKSIFDDNEEHLKNIVARFPSLTTISYTMRKSITSLAQLSTILEPLTKLVHVRLSIEAALSTEPINQDHLTPQLRSVKALDIELDHYKVMLQRVDPKCFVHLLETQANKIVQIFPHLRSIRIIHQNSIYKDDYRQMKSTLDELVMQFFDSLKASYGKELLQCTVDQTSRRKDWWNRL